MYNIAKHIHKTSVFMCSTLWFSSLKHLQPSPPFNGPVKNANLLIGGPQKAPPHHKVHLREGVVFGEIWDVGMVTATERVAVEKVDSSIEKNGDHKHMAGRNS